jgi:hypothetical protein
MIASSRGCILFATLEFYPTKANAGGAGIFMHHTARLLLERGFSVVVLFDGTCIEYEQLANVDRLAIPFGHRLVIYSVDDLCQDQVLQPGSSEDIHILKSLPAGNRRPGTERLVYSLWRSRNNRPGPTAWVRRC